MAEVTRRELLRIAGGAAAGTALVAAGCGKETAEPPPKQVDERASSPPPSPSVSPSEKPAYLAIARGAGPAAITEAAIDALGGMERFVKKGDDVIVKPNICVDYHTFEYAATTNPIVVATLITLAKKAGAKRVRVMDQPFGGTAANAYEKSGIGPAARAAGGVMEIMSPVKYASFEIPQGRDLASWSFYRDVVEADVVINVPIAKDHGTTRLTLGCKNVLGVVLDAGQIHANIMQRIADLVSVYRPTLTVVDAVRILTSNGPTGGDLSYVEKKNTVIASRDIVAADARATSLFGLAPRDIGYIQCAAAMGLGRISLKKSEVREISL